MLIVESLANGKRTPAYAHDKIISLGDISIYTTEDDTPLADVFDAIKEKYDGKSIDVKALGGDKEIRTQFATILPNFDEDRVYTNDIKKIFSWYNQLIAAGFETFKNAETASEEDKNTEETNN